jgi:hypothetical protein
VSRVTRSVYSERQADAIYFDLSSAFDLVPHASLLHEIADCANRFRSCLSNRIFLNFCAHFENWGISPKFLKIFLGKFFKFF